MQLRAIALALASACLLFSQAGEIRREGEYWVQVVSGKLTASPAAGGIEIHMRGPVRVQGGAGDAISYTLTKRVRAKSVADAQRLLDELGFRTASSKHAIQLLMMYPPRPAAMAELVVNAPSRTPAIDIRSHAGDLQVYDIAGRVSARSGGGVIQMDRIQNDIIAETDGGDIRLGRVGGTVRALSGGGTISAGRTGGESWLETAGGEIYVGESAGEVHASTGGGNIRINRAASRVAARTAAGSIEVHEAHGVVVAGNNGGSIQVGNALGCRCEATGGSIRLQGTSGALRAVSDVGSILAELVAGAKLQDSLLSTGAGDITVYIPSNIPITVKAANELVRAGRIVSEFNEIPVRHGVQLSRPAVLAEGILNGGGPILQLTAAGGTIYLRRARQ